MVGCGSSSSGGPGGAAPAVPVGLTAIPGDATATLTWTANAESDLYGYEVYQGTTSGSLSKVGTVTAPTTTYSATGLTNGAIHYFALKALDTDRNASALCDEIGVTPSLPDTTAPTVAMTQPSTTSDVPLDTAITLTFSENMNPGTVSAIFSPSITLAVSEWTDGKTLVMLPEALSQNTAYEVTVEGQDLAGNALAGSKGFSFTTVDTAPPEVLSTSPAEGATVAVTTDIAFLFSKSMDRASVENAFSSLPAVTCTWAWSTDSTLATCAHSVALDSGAPYTVTLAATATDAASLPLASANTLRFTANVVDATPPTVSSYTPGASAAGVPRSANIVVTFSEPMDKASAQAAFLITAPASHLGADGTFTWNAAGTQMTFNPNDDFAYGDHVGWRVSSSARDLAGNHMTADRLSTFMVIRQGNAVLFSTAALDGYVSSSGQVDTTKSYMFCGDQQDNSYDRAFLSFDLGSLPMTLASITHATLTVFQYGYSPNVYAHLGGHIDAESVSYGNSLASSDFETAILRTFRCSVTCIPLPCHQVCGYANEVVTLSDTSTTGFKSVDVLRKVRDDWTNRAARENRSQFRLTFPIDTDADGEADYSDLLTGEDPDPLYRPALFIAYEYP